MLGTFHDLNSDWYVKKTCEVLDVEFSYDLYENLIRFRKKQLDYFDTLNDVFLGPSELVMSRENFIKLAKELELYNFLKKWTEG